MSDIGKIVRRRSVTWDDTTDSAQQKKSGSYSRKTQTTPTSHRDQRDSQQGNHTANTGPSQRKSRYLGFVLSFFKESGSRDRGELNLGALRTDSLPHPGARDRRMPGHQENGEDQHREPCRVSWRPGTKTLCRLGRRGIRVRGLAIPGPGDRFVLRIWLIGRDGHRFEFGRTFFRIAQPSGRIADFRALLDRVLDWLGRLGARSPVVLIWVEI